MFFHLNKISLHLSQLFRIFKMNKFSPLLSLCQKTIKRFNSSTSNAPNPSITKQDVINFYNRGMNKRTFFGSLCGTFFALYQLGQLPTTPSLGKTADHLIQSSVISGVAFRHPIVLIPASLFLSRLAWDRLEIKFKWI